MTQKENQNNDHKYTRQNFFLVRVSNDGFVFLNLIDVKIEKTKNIKSLCIYKIYRHGL